MLFSLISAVFMVIAIALIMGLTPEQITDDLMSLLSPHDSLREQSVNIRGNRKKHRLYDTLLKFKNALAGTDSVAGFKLATPDTVNFPPQHCLVACNTSVLRRFATSPQQKIRSVRFKEVSPTAFFHPAKLRVCRNTGVFQKRVQSRVGKGGRRNRSQFGSCYTKAKQFSFVCFLSVVLFAAGIILSVMINNLFLMPVLSAVFALLPFLYSSKMIANFDKRTKEELETTLSAITNSYIRTDDILKSVRENLQYIKPPLNEIFKAFEGDALAVSANIRTALLNLKEKLDDEIFREWCDTLLQCQDDRTLKDALLPIVEKLSDVRVVNNELKTMLSAAKNEYWMMVALVAGNVPLLYLLNKDWFNTLIFTTQGKAVLGVCGAVILITAIFMMKFTKPISYRR